MRTYWTAGYFVATFSALWLFVSLDDPNSWTGIFWLFIAFLNTAGFLDNLTGRR